MKLRERELRRQVCSANKALAGHGLVIFSWGNVSGLNETRDLMAIKPSGVAYDILKPEDIVLVDMEGVVVEGSLKPSSDTTTHLEIYRNFDGVNGVVHTHSLYATAWAQAGRAIPCLGTTHADTFGGEIPVTKILTDDMIENDYERNTGRVIVECFKDLKPLEIPACLVLNHGPFVWGRTPAEAVENSVVLEMCARIALETLALNDKLMPIKKKLMFKHFYRKHGGSYGQG